MANFFSDSDEDKAVDDLLSQAMESTVLEQIAAIHCAGLTDSGLPSHLETRFQRLKSFPSAAAKSTCVSTKSFNLSQPSEKNGSAENPKIPDTIGGENWGKFEESIPPSSKKCRESPSKLSDSGSSFELRNPRIEKIGRNISHSSVDEINRSVSPPVKSGCFFCSPKNKGSRGRREKGNRDLDDLDWGKHDELLSDLSVNSQRKMIKKAMEEEERVCREAEKIVKWAKQVSSRMDVSGIDDGFSDDENPKFT